MALHMLAVFGPEIAHPPTAILAPEVLARPWHHFSEEERQEHEALCSASLDRAFGGAVAATTARRLSLGKGCGLCFAHGPFCSYASRGGVHALLAGEVGRWPGVDAVGEAHNAFIRNEAPPEEDDAHWLLDFYDAFKAQQAAEAAESDVTDAPPDLGLSALEWLSQLRGGFGFIIYDSENHRVMTARDASGAQPLYWGCGGGGQLLFGSCAADLDGCAPTATAFPAGTLFVSEPRRFAFQPGERGWVIEEGEAPGRLLSFVRADSEGEVDDDDDTPMSDVSGAKRRVPHRWRAVKAIPRITSQGVMCGAVFRVASAGDVAGAASPDSPLSQAASRRRDSGRLRNHPSSSDGRHTRLPRSSSAVPTAFTHEHPAGTLRLTGTTVLRISN